MCVNLNEYELLAWPSVVGRYREEGAGLIQWKSVMPALKRTRLTASAWRKANWCINCVLMRVMERRERDNS